MSKDRDVPTQKEFTVDPALSEDRSKRKRGLLREDRDR